MTIAYISKIGGEIYHKTIITIILENVGNILAGVLMIKFSSRTLFISLYIIVSILSIFAIIMNDDKSNSKKI